jgi:hypothetical protein
MNNLSFAPYVRGTLGDAWTHQEAFINEVGATSVDGTSTYSFSGEIGFMFRVTKGFNLRVGAEAFEPNPISGAVGSDSTGAQLFTLNSSVFVFNPQIVAEVVLTTFKTGNRILWTAGVGDAFVNLKNDYTVTAAGQTALGVGSYTETATAQQINGFTSAAYEFYMVDHLLGMLEVGYRYFPVTGLNHSQDQKTFAEKSGSGATSGSPLLNSDGNQRKIDLSGVFVGVSLRFYIQ